MSSILEEGLARYVSFGQLQALRSMRMQMGRGKGVSTDTYAVDNGRSTVAQHGVDQWLTYTATGFIMDYDELLTEDESNQKASTNTSINDYMAQNLPQMIKNGFTDGDWENYCNAINAYDPDAITQIYNQYTQ